MRRKAIEKMKKPIKKKPAPGDIYAVPLNERKTKFGYVRMYIEPNIAILPIISIGGLIKISDIKNTDTHTDCLSFRTAIEKNEWPQIGNIPFNDTDSAWPGPKKQVSKIRPDLRMVIHKGHLISEKEFGEYDSLPEFKKFNDLQLISQILALENEFSTITVADY